MKDKPYYVKCLDNQGWRWGECLPAENITEAVNKVVGTGVEIELIAPKSVWDSMVKYTDKLMRFQAIAELQNKVITAYEDYLSGKYNFNCVKVAMQNLDDFIGLDQ